MPLECVMETSNENINCLRFNIMSYRHYIMHTPTFLTDRVQHHTFLYGNRVIAKMARRDVALLEFFFCFFLTALS